MSQRIDVMISSTARDLPTHRHEAVEACLRQGMYPIRMEDLPASGSEAITVSLGMVDEAEIYLAIIAFRYGFLPDDPRNPDGVSITEMEYRRAKERGVERMIFIMSDAHDLKGGDVETGDGAPLLNAFKERLKGENIVNFFDSPADLRAKIIDSLAKYKQRDDKRPTPGADIHYVSEIPPAPEPYIAHPYTLMHASRLFGRAPELNLLTDWVAKPSASVYRARILNVVAIGGMGKSALTWKWFNEDAPHEMKPLAGRMWWSFYESDAHFENFIIRALAYVTGQTHEEIRTTTKPGGREDMLFNALDQKPYLLVLDGLERILIAYARMDAARLSDDDYDKAAANWVADVHGLPEGAGEQFVGQVQLRKAADPRAGAFLRRLATVRQSRILVSTRLYPAELQIITGHPIPGSSAVFLTGLHDDDALNLWRDLGVSGGRDELLRVFRRFDNYPLLIRALAGEVARFRRAPGDFDVWREHNPDFTPVLEKLRHEDTKSHVLAYALKDLGADRRAVLNTLAAFRAPAGYETLVALMVKGVERPKPAKPSRLEEIRRGLKLRTENVSQGDESDEHAANPEPDTRLFATEAHLDSALDELEQRGLIGWDRRANRYDLHPIVRGVTWGNVDEDARRDVYEALRGHFESVPQISDWEQVNTLDDLTPAIELYQALVGLGRYDEAVVLFRDRIMQAAHFRLNAQRQNAELLEMLFRDGLDQLPCLSQPSDQAWTLNSLALAYQFSGHPGRAAPLFRREIGMREEQSDLRNASVTLCNLSDALRLVGGLREAESAARRALVINREQANRFREAVSLGWWGLALAARGVSKDAEVSLRLKLQIDTDRDDKQGQCVDNTYLAQAMLWRGDFAAARELADRAWQLAHVQRYERDFIRSARLQGEVALGLGDFETASERLHYALTRARAVNYAQEELPALVALAEMVQRQNNPDEARRLLDDLWDAAERAPYPLTHADALNVLAQIERDAGNHDAAVVAARGAYEKAWCDGPPFAYHWGLEKAKAHLDALGATYPNLPPFDESKHEPMPEVEIDPN